MATWIPINKKTGVRYPAVDDAGKGHYEADPMTKGKFRFELEKGSAPATTPKATKKKEEITPVGVELPETEEQ